MISTGGQKWYIEGSSEDSSKGTSHGTWTCNNRNSIKFYSNSRAQDQIQHLQYLQTYRLGPEVGSRIMIGFSKDVTVNVFEAELDP